MSLIEIFTDYIVKRKSLRDYVEVRKTINARGEFNDETLLLAQDTLDRLGREEPELLEKMYALLGEIIAQDEGHKVEYPLNFTRQILRCAKEGATLQKVYEDYRQTLSHHYRDAN